VKPVPSESDLSTYKAQLKVELAAEQDDLRTAKRHATERARHAAGETAALESAEARRKRIGGILAKARIAWPKAGPGAKGWGDFLRDIGIGEDSALRYMAEAKGQLPQKPALRESDPDDDTGARQPAPRGIGEPPQFRQLSELEIMDSLREINQAIARLDPEARKRISAAAKLANVHGGSGEEERGAWCTGREMAAAVGPWDLDPFSNPRSKIASVVRCMLEDGGDAFGGGEPGATPGLYLTGNSHGMTPRSGMADATTRVWLQPPYRQGFVDTVVAHYKHTRFCALLRFAPDTAWFGALWPRVAVLCVPFGERMPFDPPPGVPTSGGATYPHALYYADERDITDAVRARCLVWRVDHALDCAVTAPEPALHIVK
jgi:hypothetical protein